MEREKIHWTFLDTNRCLAIVIYIAVLILAIIPAFCQKAEGIVFPKWVPAAVLLIGPPLIFFRVHFLGGLHLPDWEEEEIEGEVENSFTGYTRAGRLIYYRCKRCGRVAGKIIH